MFAAFLGAGGGAAGVAAPNMSPGILKEGAVIENAPGRPSENVELESPASDYLFPAFLLLLMEFIKHYWSLELRAKLYNNIEQLYSGSKCQAALCSTYSRPWSPPKTEPWVHGCAGLTKKKSRH